MQKMFAQHKKELQDKEKEMIEQVKIISDQNEEVAAMLKVQAKSLNEKQEELNSESFFKKLTAKIVGKFIAFGLNHLTNSNTEKSMFCFFLKIIIND